MRIRSFSSTLNFAITTLNEDKADDNVNDYEYDFTFENNMPIEESTALFKQLIDIITNLD